jgi:hypothetical protein
MVSLATKIGLITTGLAMWGGLYYNTAEREGAREELAQEIPELKRAYELDSEFLKLERRLGVGPKVGKTLENLYANSQIWDKYVELRQEKDNLMRTVGDIKEVTDGDGLLIARDMLIGMALIIFGGLPIVLNAVERRENTPQ